MSTADKVPTGGAGAAGERRGPLMSPERFRIMVSTILLLGVTASAVLIAAGFLTALAVGWQGSIAGLAVPGGTTADPTDFGALPDRLGALEPLALSQLGLLALLATPVLRVAASVVGFALEGDRLYAGLTFAVLAVLLLSIFVLR
jgi:uncharacterized membrane protein